jgi:hypothetical protein
VATAPEAAAGTLDQIPAATLDAPVTGVNLMPGTLRDQIGSESHLLVFLRHFGCVFCRETLADLRAAVEREADYPGVLFFFQGSAAEGRAFLRRYWPQVRAVADPDLTFYEAFGIGRMGWASMLRPALWDAHRRARAKGHEQGASDGSDVWRLPGVFLVEGDRILWAHRYRHAGDEPDFGAIASLARSLRVEAASLE